MTKKEIVKTISEKAKLTQLKTKEIVQWTFDAIIETLAEEGRIELRNFGVFEVRQRKARKARNPRTGTPVDVEPKNVVVFQPGKEMDAAVRHSKPIGPRSRARNPKPKAMPKPAAIPATIPIEEPVILPITTPLEPPYSVG